MDILTVQKRAAKIPDELLDIADCIENVVKKYGTIPYTESYLAVKIQRNVCERLKDKILEYKNNIAVTEMKDENSVTLSLLNQYEMMVSQNIRVLDDLCMHCKSTNKQLQASKIMEMEILMQNTKKNLKKEAEN